MFKQPRVTKALTEDYGAHVDESYVVEKKKLRGHRANFKSSGRDPGSSGPTNDAGGDSMNNTKKDDKKKMNASVTELD